MIDEEGYLKKGILIVDDDYDIVCVLEETFKKQGFKNIETAKNGIDAILLAKDKDIDIIILDVNLPDIDGFSVCEKIRTFCYAPIIFLTANNEDENKLKGLSVGGDDYVTKPFNIQEVVFRTRAQLRRSFYFSKCTINEEKIISIGNISIDEEKSEVRKNDQIITLTAKEYQILLFLAKNRGKIFSKGTLCEKLWGYDYDGCDNMVMVHIRHLRQKIEKDPSNPEYIKTLKGLGYKLVAK